MAFYFSFLFSLWVFAAPASAAAPTPTAVALVLGAHDAELIACAATAAEPVGEVVLLLSIASSGSPLGVLVERSSPNLAAAGECMRRKALRWRFPPSQRNLTARYPLRFARPA